MRQKANGVAAGLAIATGVLASLGFVRNAEATNFATGPALVVHPNKAITLYAVESQGFTILRQQSSQHWQSTGISATAGFTSQLAAAAFRSPVYFNGSAHAINGTLDHQIVCGAARSLQNQSYGTLRCWATNIDLGESDTNELTPIVTHGPDWGVETGNPAVVSLHLDGTGHARVYAASPAGIFIKGFDGTCPQNGNFYPCFLNLGFVNGTPQGVTGVGAAVVNEGDGPRVRLCGVKSNSEYWCTKATDANGTTFGAWDQVPGGYSGAPAVVRWRTAFGDATKTFGRAPDQSIWTATRFFGTWGQPTEVGGHFLNPITAGVMSYANDPTVVEMFGRGLDGRIWHSSMSDSGFSGWTHWLWQ
jgi:hypothetical protein